MNHNGSQFQEKTVDSRDDCFEWTVSECHKTYYTGHYEHDDCSSYGRSKHS